MVGSNNVYANNSLTCINIVKEEIKRYASDNNRQI